VRRRIRAAIVGVTAAVLVALGFPLALAVNRLILDSEVLALQARAATTLAEIATPIDLAQVNSLGGEADAPPPFSLYSADGALLFGDGPPQPDAAVLAALHGTTSSTTRTEIVVATPVNDRSETIVGALRLHRSLDGVQRRARLAWLIMGLAAAAAVAVAWLIGNRLATRLSRPVTDLAAAADHVGHGGVLDHHDPVGIDEIDLLGETLVQSSRRINDVLARERRFSADVSHQLRTPLTAMRLKLENASRDGSGRPFDPSVLDDLARIEGTVEHLLAFARDAIPPVSESALDEVVSHAVGRWADRAAVRNRSLVAPAVPSVVVRASTSSIDQVLDVLIDNALIHGTGTVEVRVRLIAGGAAVDVTDEGPQRPEAFDENIFERGTGTNTGIGLALARSIAEAEGGRLLLVHRAPTTFSLVLLMC
jgi:signal transduction histidine kinase